MTSEEKVLAIFGELLGEHAKRLKGSAALSDSIDRIAGALSNEEDGASPEQAHEIGFHLMDWQSDAAFLVAVALFPERFTDEEIQDGVRGLLLHAPHHVLEAARQGGYETRNIFSDDEKA